MTKVLYSSSSFATSSSILSLFKIFYYNVRDIRIVKNLQKLSNKEIYFTYQNNNENYIKPFKFVTWTNTLEENSVFTPQIWDKAFTNWHKLIHFSLSPALHRIGNNPNSLCPRCKEREESHPHFIFHCRLSQVTLGFINKLINRNYTF